MNREQIEKKLIQDLADYYGYNTETLLKEGTSFRNIKSFDGKNALYITKIYNRHIISAGKELISHLSDLSNGGETVLDIENLKEIFTTCEVKNTHPHYIYFKESVPEYKLHDGYTVKVVAPEDHKAIQAFIDINSAEDIDDAEVYLDDPDEEIRMVYNGDQPVVYAAYRRYEKNMGDVGILVHPDHRRKGLGIAAVIETTKACLDNNLIPFYRTSSDNTGSKSIAQNMGYELMWTVSECNCEI